MTSSHGLGGKWGTTQTTFKSAFANNPVTKPTPKSTIPQQFKKPKPALINNKPLASTGNEIPKPVTSASDNAGPTSITNSSTAQEPILPKESTANEIGAEVVTTKAASLPKNNEISTTTSTTPNNTGGGSTHQLAVGATPNSGTGATQAPTSALGKMFNFVNYFKNDNNMSEKKGEIANISKAGLVPRFDVDAVKSPTDTSHPPQVTNTANNKEFQIKE